MSFHEKSAWVMAMSLLISAGFYVHFVVSASQAAGGLVPPLLPIFIAFTAVLVVAAVIGHIVAAATALSEADAPQDERDRHIAQRATSAGGVMLSLGVLVALGVYLVTYQGDWLFYAVFASLLLASIIEWVTRIVLYRLG